MDTIKIVLLSLLLSGFLFTGCSSEDVAPDAVLKIDHRAKNELIIENSSSETIYYFLVERQTTALILWAPSVNFDTPQIDSHSFVSIKYEDIIGYTSESKEVVLYSWHAVEMDGQTQPGEIKTEILTL